MVVTCPRRQEPKTSWARGIQGKRAEARDDNVAGIPLGDFTQWPRNAAQAQWYTRRECKTGHVRGTKEGERSCDECLNPPACAEHPVYFLIWVASRHRAINGLGDRVYHELRASEYFSRDKEALVIGDASRMQWRQQGPFCFVNRRARVTSPGLLPLLLT